MSPARERRFRRLLQAPDEDPLSGLANLFDAGIVFAVALLVGVAVRVNATQREDSPSLDDALERERTVPLERFRVGDRQLEGQGERLGYAYRLANGEVVYVPEER
jgi:hypothetical protein